MFQNIDHANEGFIIEPSFRFQGACGCAFHACGGPTCAHMPVEQCTHMLMSLCSETRVSDLQISASWGKHDLFNLNEIAGGKLWGFNFDQFIR